MPADGFCEITLPIATVSLFSNARFPVTSPASSIAFSASDCVRPTRFGTVLSETGVSAINTDRNSPEFNEILWVPC